MTKEAIINFSQLKAEPAWLQDRRLAAFEQIDQLELPRIEKVRFNRWNLGDGSLAENEATANVPDFAALSQNPQLVQVGSQTVLEQLSPDLIDKGVVFTDFASALGTIPEVLEANLSSL